MRVSVEVTKTREQRWRQAARAAQQTLPEWIASAVDAAAEATLIGPPPGPEDELLEPGRPATFTLGTNTEAA